MELRFACSGAGALHISNDAFFEVAPSHVHYARVGIDGAPALELLFSDAHRERSVGGAAGEAQGDAASFAAYLELGIEHILAGADHVAFLLALLLLCRRLRDVLLLVTGFTLGHSLTLTLAVLGYVRPDVRGGGGIDRLHDRARRGRERRRAPAGPGASRSPPSPPRASWRSRSRMRRPGSACPPRRASVSRSSCSRISRWRPTPQRRCACGRCSRCSSVSCTASASRTCCSSWGSHARHLALALFGFNLGVEIGQLAIVAALWLGGRALARASSGTRVPALAFDALSAALCGLGIHWFVARALGS